MDSSEGAFVSTFDSNNPASILSIQVPSGAVSTYNADGWNNAGASGNQAKYGVYHKEILITVTP
jgi:hypothetical protein